MHLNDASPLYWKKPHGEQSHFADKASILDLHTVIKTTMAELQTVHTRLSHP